MILACQNYPLSFHNQRSECFIIKFMLHLITLAHKHHLRRCILEGNRHHDCTASAQVGSAKRLSVARLFSCSLLVRIFFL
jgi:hypothetical protein